MKWRASWLPLFAVIAGSVAPAAAELSLPAQRLKQPPKAISEVIRLSRTCKPNYAPTVVFRDSEGGLVSLYQGMFLRAEVKQGNMGPASLYCYYKGPLPCAADWPLFSVHYELTGYSKGMCSVQGATVNCARTLEQSAQ